MKPDEDAAAKVERRAGAKPRALTLAGCLVLGAALGPAPLAAAGADWPQFGYDARHSGNNPAETALGAANVATLGVRYHVALPGVVDGPPVFLAGAATPQGTKDLLFLETRKGMLLALDAATGAMVWARRPANQPGYTTSSPAIDPGRQFVYAYGLDGKVHKYAVGDGSEVTSGGWPQTATLKPAVEQGAAALSVATAADGSSYLYVASSGYPGSAGDYQGHVTAIDLATGTQRVWNAVCSDQAVHFAAGGAPDCTQTQAGVWARAGVAYDSDLDRIFFATGVGAFDADHGGHDWGDSVLALHPDGTGAAGGLPVDSYTPNDFQDLQNAGEDLGCTAPAILPAAPASRHPHLAVQGGREPGGELHLIDLDNLSGQGGPGHTAGELEPVPVTQGGPLLTAPAVWVDPQDGNVWIFFANDNGISAMQLFVDAAGNPTIFPQWNEGGGGSSPVVANGILYYAGAGGLRALDPVTGKQLFADAGIGPIHWESPIVAGGRLYVADENATLWAYQPGAAPPTLHPLPAPCRVVDTRRPAGPDGGPPLTGGASRTFAIAGQCGVPAGAQAVAANVIALRPASRGSLAVSAAGAAAPGVTVSFHRGQVRAAAGGTIALTGSPAGSVSATAHLAGNGGSVSLVLDVTGYYQ
ncbi:MAG TPA: PQQ-binding-like beta-propeller repeat protein [Thermoanaerobaculia bacterium]|nr:PQQ-binding-like beta-propeller repeat protein [Thermoanaerobaculia bacterium]